jgi:hypothetical protein
MKQQTEPVLLHACYIHAYIPEVGILHNHRCENLKILIPFMFLNNLRLVMDQRGRKFEVPEKFRWKNPILNFKKSRAAVYRLR